MRRLSAADITRICEWGYDKHDLDRAVALLRLAEPGATPEALSFLPIGQRDAQLMRLRAEHFGDKFEMRVGCPKCDISLEFSMNMSDLLQDDSACPEPVISCDVGTVQYRLPNSVDMASISHLSDPVMARQALLGRCLSVTGENGEPVHPSKVPPETLDDVVRRWGEEDPQADITFKLSCSACAHQWRTVFDILSYFWLELETFNRRLQDDVHQIAGHYGWTEQSILQMTPERRNRYIELIGD